MDKQVKSGKEILDEFFIEIQDIEGVDNQLAKVLTDLYSNGKLTDTNIKTEFDNLRRNGTD